MTRFTDHDPEDQSPRSKRRLVLFLALLFVISTLIYAEMIMRFSS